MAFRITRSELVIRGENEVRIRSMSNGVWRQREVGTFVVDTVYDYSLDDFDWYSSKDLVSTGRDGEIQLGEGRYFFRFNGEIDYDYEIILGRRDGHVEIVILGGDDFPYEYGCDRCYRLFESVRDISVVAGEDLCRQCQLRLR